MEDGERRRHGEASDWERRELVWRRFWRTKVPEGMKILTWRLYHNALPIFRNLSRRGVDVQRECRFCGYKEESIRHLFLECWWAKCLWRGLGITLDYYDIYSNPHNWLWKKISEADTAAVANIILGVYLIWSNINRVIHNQQGWTVEYCNFKSS